MLKNKKGQSTLEYIVLVTAVVAALLVFLGPSGIFQSRLGNTLNITSNSMENMAGRFAASRPLSP